MLIYSSLAGLFAVSSSPYPTTPIVNYLSWMGVGSQLDFWCICVLYSKKSTSVVKLWSLFPRTQVMRTTEEFSGARARHKTRYHGFKHIDILKGNLFLKYPQGVRARESNELQRKFETNIPQKGIGRLQSQFLHSCICERFMHSDHRSAYSAAGKEVDRSGEYKNRS